MARILVDMDGVLCNLVGKWFAVYNREYGDQICLDDLDQWGPHRIARAGKAVYKYLSQPGFFRDLEPIDGAIDGVRTLLAKGHDVVIVTAARRGHRDKLDWLAQHLPFLPRDNVVFAHRKELVRGDLLFDDAPHNLQAFAPYGIPVAMAYRYNSGLDCHRVPDWPSFLSLVDRLFPSPLNARGASYKLKETKNTRRSTPVDPAERSVSHGGHRRTGKRSPLVGKRP